MATFDKTCWTTSVYDSWSRFSGVRPSVWLVGITTIEWGIRIDPDLDWIIIPLIKCVIRTRFSSNNAHLNIFTKVTSSRNIEYSRLLLLVTLPQRLNILSTYHPFNIRITQVILLNLSISQCFTKPDIWCEYEIFPPLLLTPDPQCVQILKISIWCFFQLRKT